MRTQKEAQRSSRRRKFQAELTESVRTVVFGSPGTGKTTCTVQDLIGWPGDLIGCDPHGSLSRATHAEFPTIPFISIPYSNIGFIYMSSTGDEEIDRRERMLVKRCFMGRREDVTTTGSPLINEILDVALKAIQSSGAELFGIPFCFMPWTGEFHAIKDRADEQTADRMEQWARFSPHQVRSELSPALRLTEPVCFDPAFKRLCGRAELRSVIIEGYGADYDTIRTILLWVIYRIFQRAEQEVRPLHLVIDEAETYGLVTEELIRWLLTLRKQDVWVTVICHALGFEESVVRRLLQACNRLVVYRSSAEVAFLLAKEIATANFDSHAVHSTETRYRSRRVGEDWLESPEVSTRYEGYQDQVTRTAQKIMQLNVGERFVVMDGHAMVEQVSLQRDVWGIKSAKARAIRGR